MIKLTYDYNKKTTMYTKYRSIYNKLMYSKGDHLKKIKTKCYILPFDRG